MSDAETIVNEAIKSTEATPIWGEPATIETELLPVAAFNPDALLPDILKDWVMDVAKRMVSPPDFAATAALAFIGSVIGARCVIKPKQKDDWSIVPNLWGANVSLPSTKKSPALNAALQPLDWIITKETEKHKKEMDDFKKHKIKRDAQKSALERLLKKAADNEINSNYESEIYE